jgi:hypothetical protein
MDLGKNFQEIFYKKKRKQMPPPFLKVWKNYFLISLKFLSAMPVPLTIFIR